MRILSRGLRPAWLLGLGLALLVSGCSTLEYRKVQQTFEEAVQADNNRVVSPFTDAADANYDEVARKLTAEFIQGLDRKLQPNAWTLRAVSSWRTGEFSDALYSSSQGLALIRKQAGDTNFVAQSRDSIILTMVPALVTDSLLTEKLHDMGRAIPGAVYQAEFAKRHLAALRELDEARAKWGPATPASVQHYWAYQRWRLIQNWRITLDRIADPAARSDAKSKAERALGMPLKDAADQAEKMLPEDHPYRRLIRYQTIQ